MRPFLALAQLLISAGLGFAVIWGFSNADPSWMRRPLTGEPLVDLTGVLPERIEAINIPEPTAHAAVIEHAPAEEASGPTVRVAPPFNGLSSAPALALALESEPLRLQAEQDEEGTWVIGYGRRLTAASDRAITRAQAEEMLREDIAHAEEAIRAGVAISLSGEEYAALVEFARMIGPETFGDTLVATLLNAEDREAAADAMMIWSRARIDGELVDSPSRVGRLERLRALFLSTPAA
jgi:lysozyme